MLSLRNKTAYLKGQARNRQRRRRERDGRGTKKFKKKVLSPNYDRVENFPT